MWPTRWILGLPPIFDAGEDAGWRAVSHGPLCSDPMDRCSERGKGADNLAQAAISRPWHWGGPREGAAFMEGSRSSQDAPQSAPGLDSARRLRAVARDDGAKFDEGDPSVSADGRWVYFYKVTKVTVTQ